MIVTGAARIALAASEPLAPYGFRDVATTARRDGDCWLIDGTKSVVVVAPEATHLIVTARTSGERQAQTGISLFLVDRDINGIISHNYSLIDGRSAADLALKNLRVRAGAFLGSEGEALPLLELVADEATAAVGPEAVGVMRRMLQDTIDYTKQRSQFGQALASFQVLQHRMVDMYMMLEQAVSAVYLATLKVGQLLDGGCLQVQMGRTFTVLDRARVMASREAAARPSNNDATDYCRRLADLFYMFGKFFEQRRIETVQLFRAIENECC